MTNHAFPTGFTWGTATASYQVEGSPLADGAGMSIWHRFSHTPGNTHNGDNGDVACDHYRRYLDDVALMKELGVNAYRFSIAWGRVLPAGHGAVNQAGIDFYSRLVDALLEAGITPWVTLYHWDLPTALQDAGGWANRDTAGHFADYAAVVYRALGDRVSHWITLNEPHVVSAIGHLVGIHAPGTRDIYVAMRVAHHQLLGHGLAVQACRAAGGGQIGITNSMSPQHPATGSDEDVAAAARNWEWGNQVYLDTVVRGEYPALVRRQLDYCWPPILDGDMAVISEPVDFVGVNYYSRGVVRHSPGTGVMDAATLPVTAPSTAMGWEIYPEGLYELLTWMRDRYPGVAIYITENGCALEDVVEPDGSIQDQDRIRYVRDHLLAAHRAIQNGVDLRGYFLWSFLDNFEWADGYSKRFGIVRCDYETQRRIPKASARWYGEVAGAGSLDDAPT
ncbi:MAG: GH1 family beta-glucosidase [Candidatus Dormibacteria bacterium]